MKQLPPRICNVNWDTVEEDMVELREKIEEIVDWISALEAKHEIK